MVIDPSIVTVLTDILGGVGATAITSSLSSASPNIKSHFTNSNSIDPSPGFQLESVSTPVDTEVYVRVTDFSHSWVELVLLTQSSTNRFRPVSSFPLELAKLAPSTDSRFLVGRINSEVEPDVNDEVSIEVLFKQVNKKEKPALSVVFEGSTKELDVILSESDPTVSSIAIVASPVSKALNVSASEWISSQIESALVNTKGLKRLQYESQLDEWASSSDLKDTDIEAILAKQFFSVSVKNTSLDRDYRNLRLTLRFPDELKLCSIPATRKAYAPDFQQLPSIPALTAMYEQLSEPFVYSDGYILTDDLLEVDIDILHANAEENILVGDPDSILVWFGTTKKVKVEVEVRVDGQYYKLSSLELQAI